MATSAHAVPLHVAIVVLARYDMRITQSIEGALLGKAISTTEAHMRKQTYQTVNNQQQRDIVRGPQYECNTFISSCTL